MWLMIETGLCIVLYLAGAGAYQHYAVQMRREAALERVESQTAEVWYEMGEAMHAYAKALGSGMPDTVTCQSLQAGGYLSTSFGGGNCTDPTGTQLMATATATSWAVSASGVPSRDFLARFGISVGNDSWKAFLTAVAVDLNSMRQNDFVAIVAPAAQGWTLFERNATN